MDDDPAGNIFLAILQVYLMIGIMLGLIAWGSYVAPFLGYGPARFDREVQMVDRVYVALTYQPRAIGTAVVRTFLWAPSLWLWAENHPEEDFEQTVGQWLAPGFHLKGR